MGGDALPGQAWGAALAGSRAEQGAWSWLGVVFPLLWDVKCSFPECLKGNLNVKTFVIA